jgi:hypothetical protein
MNRSSLLPKRSRLLVAALLLIASCSLLSAQAWPDQPAARRLDAQRRWAARPFKSYRIVLRVEYWGNVCSQEIEATGESIQRIVHNNCQLSWLSVMTVARLFQISEELEHPMPCFVTAQTCSCYRVRASDISFDPQLGYPRLIAYRRETFPNLVHIAYWRRLWQTRQLPDCGPLSPVVRVTITSLSPIG